MLANTFGWGAAALMVATFSCRDPLWMRPLAVCTNVAFIGYACTAGLPPVLALHALLLPINVMRWWQSARHSRARKPGREARGSVAPGLVATWAIASAVSAEFTAHAPPARPEQDSNTHLGV